MNIGFFSSMIGGSWGGSEELWAAGARAALAAGHSVRLSVPRWRPRAAPIDALGRGGAVVCERHQYRSKRVRRIADLLTLHDRRFNAGLDVLCISQGGSYDFLTMQHRSMFDRLTHGGHVPYVVLCLYNDERSVPTEALRERARKFFRGAFRVVFVADQNRRLASRQLVCELPNAVVMNNPVNLADTRAVPWPSPSPGGVRFSCVARFSVRHKGHDALLEALSAPVWRDRPWQLRLYGTGPDEAYVRALVEHFGLAKHVLLMGHVADIRALWQDNELLILPSYGEGTPLALIEAMLCGRPALVTDVGGNVEWVEEGVTGFVAAAPTARSIAKALERAWEQRSRWRGMGDAARARALESHDASPGRTLLALLEDAARAVTSRVGARVVA